MLFSDETNQNKISVFCHICDYVGFHFFKFEGMFLAEKVCGQKNAKYGYLES